MAVASTGFHGHTFSATRAWLPSPHAWPHRNDVAAARAHDVIPVVLCSGGASVIRQNAYARADRQIWQRGPAAGTDRGYSVFLACIDDDQIGVDRAIDIADDTIALVDRMT